MKTYKTETYSAIGFKGLLEKIKARGTVGYKLVSIFYHHHHDPHERSWNIILQKEINDENFEENIIVHPTMKHPPFKKPLRPAVEGGKNVR